MNAVLAFDTATEHMSIALGSGAGVWTHEAPGGAQASAALIPAILALLAEASITLRDLDAIAFGRGPGPPQPLLIFTARLLRKMLF